jgi:hypothetical protein
LLALVFKLLQKPYFGFVEKRTSPVLIPVPVPVLVPVGHHRFFIAERNSFPPKMKDTHVTYPKLHPKYGMEGMNHQSSSKSWISKQVKAERFAMMGIKASGSGKLQIFDSQENFSQCLTELTEVTSFSDLADEQIFVVVKNGGLHIVGGIDSSMDDDLLSFSLDEMAADQEACLPEGMPCHVTCIDDSVDSMDDVNIDVYKRLGVAETLVESYKSQLQSTEHLIETLHENLRETQDKVEDLAFERNGYRTALQELEQGSSSKKAVVAFALFIYLFGGSAYILVVAVALFLLDDFINVFLP